jgi:CHAT domain-containing protein
VWTPLAGRVRGKRVLIVADGVLQYVPFAALPSDGGKPLLASNEIVYLPSASVLDTLRRNSRALAADPPIAVFADPVFSKDDSRLTGGSGAPGRGTASRSGDNYPRLRFSRTEAQAIAAASKGAFEALDFAAAKQTLTSRNLRGYRVLHFATHGVLNTEHPELSGLVLSLIDRNGRRRRLPAAPRNLQPRSRRRPRRAQRVPHRRSARRSTVKG